MLRVSRPKYLFDLLQQLLSPSTSSDQPWSHRRNIVQKCDRLPGWQKRVYYVNINNLITHTVYLESQQQLIILTGQRKRRKIQIQIQIQIVYFNWHNFFLYRQIFCYGADMMTRSTQIQQSTFHPDRCTGTSSKRIFWNVWVSGCEVGLH